MDFYIPFFDTVDGAIASFKRSADRLKELQSKHDSHARHLEAQAYQHRQEAAKAKRISDKINDLIA